MFIPKIFFEDAETQIRIRAKNIQQTDGRKEKIRIHMEHVRIKRISKISNDESQEDNKTEK